MTRPTARDIKAMAETAGVPVDDEAAIRVTTNMGPVFEGFSTIAGTLPMDLEPAHFVLAQASKV